MRWLAFIVYKPMTP